MSIKPGKELNHCTKYISTPFTSFIIIFLKQFFGTDFVQKFMLFQKDQRNGQTLESKKQIIGNFKLYVYKGI